MSQNEVRLEIANGLHHVTHSPQASQFAPGHEEGTAQALHSLEFRQKGLLGRLQGAKARATSSIEMQWNKRLHQSLYS